MEPVLTAKGKHRVGSASSSNLLVVRLFITEDLKGLGRANGALGWFYSWSLWRARASVGERCLHRYQVAHGTERKGRRGLSQPVLQHKMEWVRKSLTAVISQRDLSKDAEEKASRRLSHTPW